jgi:hypothetical protein
VAVKILYRLDDMVEIRVRIRVRVRVGVRGRLYDVSVN